MISPEFITIIITGCVGIFGAGAAWNNLSGKYENVSKKSEQIDKWWEWKDRHEKESVEVRLGFQMQISSINSRVSVHDEQNAHILRSLLEMKEMMTSISEKLEVLQLRRE